MKKDFEILDVAGDVGARAHGATLADALAKIADALVSFLVSDSVIVPRQTREIAIAAEDEESLVVRVLNELIYLFETEGFIPARIDLAVTGVNAVRVRLSGERFDPVRHRRGIVVKAATYHDLAIARDEKGVSLTVIFDV